MSEKVSASQALGHRRMRAGAKEEVIAYLAATDLPGATRRRWFREWCKATHSSCLRDDIARVAPPAKPKEQLLPLRLE